MKRFGLAACTMVLAAGCASLEADRNHEEAVAYAKTHAGTGLQWLRTDGDRARARAEVEALLAQPLSGDDAVRIALAYSPSLQALLFEGAAASAQSTQTARLPNPVFTFEHLVRRDMHGVDKDIGRMLGFSLLELLTLPARLEANNLRQQQLRLKGAADVLQGAGRAREMWVRAVAAEQAFAYHVQVKDAAEASAELARRMQAVGNFSKLQRAREQVFYAEATAQLARATQAAKAAREALVRTLGLDAAQAAKLKLLERLPDLPAAPDDEQAAGTTALEARLDVRMAQAELAFLARTLGLTRVTGFIEGVHVAAVRNSETGKAPQKGYEIELPLPLFDFGDARRAGAEATYRAALSRAAAVGTNAVSHLRESYGAYRTAYDLAKHYRDEIVPLRKAIAEDMLFKYNGMLIGVFELLADAREQSASVIAAIDAQRDFWLADAGLRATRLGQPGDALEMTPRAPMSGAGARH